MFLPISKTEEDNPMSKHTITAGGSGAPILLKPVYDPVYHLIHLHHAGAPEQKCYIALGKKCPNSQTGWYQRCYRPGELPDVLRDPSWGEGRDVYFSLNNFFLPQRASNWTRDIRGLYVDIDYYKLDRWKSYRPEAMLEYIFLEYVEEGRLPKPSYVIFSGTGLQLVYLVNPVDYLNDKAFRLWKKLQDYLIQTLRDVGADPACSDPARVFRLAGTYNSKTGRRIYLVQYLAEPYSMEILADEWLPELVPHGKPSATSLQNPTPRRKPSRHSKSQNGSRKTEFSPRTLHLARARDLEKLVRLRRGEMDGYRECTLFLYRYLMLLLTNDPQEALEKTRRLNEMFSEPLPPKEVEQATRSAEKMWQSQNEKAGCSINRKNPASYQTLSYFYSNEKIIEQLNISHEEQRELATIIGPEEKKRRDRERKEQRRRAANRPTRLMNTARMEEKIRQVRQILEAHPGLSIRQISRMTGFSKSSVQRYLKHA